MYSPCMLSRIAGALILLLTDWSLSGQGPPVPLDNSNHFGSIRLVATDSFGRPLAAVTIKISSCKNIEFGGEFRSHFREGFGTNIPYGRYEVIVQQNLSRSNVLKQINLDRLERVVPLGFNVDSSLEDLGPAYSTVAGRVKNYNDLPKYLTRWVKLTGMFVDQAYDSEISAEGNFTVEDVVPGQYLLTIREGTTVILVSVVSIHGSGQKDIVVEIDKHVRPTQIN